MKPGLVLRGKQLFQKRMTENNLMFVLKQQGPISQITYIIIKRMFKIQLVRSGNLDPFTWFTYEWSAWVVCWLKYQMGRIKVLAKREWINWVELHESRPKSIFNAYNLLNWFIQKIGDGDVILFWRFIFIFFLGGCCKIHVI